MKNEYGLKNIALELNLSITAVSRALKDCDDISESTKEIVRDKAIELGYIPKCYEKNHKKDKSYTIAVFVDSLRSPYFGMIVEKIIDSLKRKGYKTLIIPTNINMVYKENINEAISLNVDGIITFLIPKKDAYQLCALNQIPIILFGRNYDFKYLNVVRVDDYMGGEIACRYLIQSKGATKLCYVGVPNLSVSKERLDGFLFEAENEGINDIVILNSDNINTKLSRLIEQGYHWFFCFDDQLASFVLNQNKKNNLFVVGFNGTSRFYDYAYNITSIEADYDLMVNDSVDLMLNLVENKENIRRYKIVKKYNTTLYLGDS